MATTPNWVDCVIDVSHNNGMIDWTQVDPSIILVFAKATQGSHFKDSQFQANKEGCAATGRLFIPYHFFDATDPDQQIANFEPHLDQGKPFMLDWEGRQSSTLPPDDVEYVGMQIAADMNWGLPVGYWGIKGSTPGYPIQKPTQLMNTWTKFTPRYPHSGAESFADIPDHFHDLISDPFWQYTQWGRVTGIAGNVDRSVWNGTSDSLKLWFSAIPPQQP